VQKKKGGGRDKDFFLFKGISDIDNVL